MNTKDFYELCKSGKTPTIKMSENIYEFAEESFDSKMMGKVINVDMEYDDSYRLLVDMNGYEKHNKSVAQYDWRDDKGELTLSWFDTKYYPENGIEALYVPLEAEIPFEIISDNSLFSAYLKSDKDISYLDWLESYVEWMEGKMTSGTIAREEFNNYEK